MHMPFAFVCHLCRNVDVLHWQMFVCPVLNRPDYELIIFADVNLYFMGRIIFGATGDCLGDA